MTQIDSKAFDAPNVRIRGRVSRDGKSAVFSPCVRTFRAATPAPRSKAVLTGPGGIQLPPGSMPLPPIIVATGAYDVVVEGQRGKVLDTRQVKPEFPTSKAKWGRFAVRVPHRADAVRIVLKQGTRVVAAMAVSQHLPQFKLAAPLTATGIDFGGILALEWQPVGPSATEPLTYFVRFSPDGKAWTRLAATIRNNRCLVDMNGLPGGGACRFQIIASNGYHTAMIETPEFVRPDRPPRILVGGTMGPLLVAQGVSDRHGALVGNAISWLADGKEVAQGSTFDVRELAAGVKALGVTVRGPSGESASRELGRFDTEKGRVIPPVAM